MQPIWKLLNGTEVGEEWGHAERAGLKSTILNRQWPQARLHHAGLAADPNCKLCERFAASRDSVPAGTLGHRVYSCAVLEPWRRRLADPMLVQEVAAQSRAVGCPLGDGIDSAPWLRGLFPMPIVPQRAEDDTFVWMKRPPEGVCKEGVVYTDGSLMDGSHQFAGLCARLGWAFVVVDEDRNVLAVAHGRPPWWVDSIQGAELWALSKAAECCFSHLSFRTDCYSALQGVEHGVAWATASSRKYARVWTRIFHYFDAGLPDLAWMPAHTALHDVGVLWLSNGQLLTHQDRFGNNEADRWAKAAACGDRVPREVRNRFASLSVRASHQGGPVDRPGHGGCSALLARRGRELPRLGPIQGQA